MQIKYGLIVKNPKPSDFIFGAFTPLDVAVINELGDWSDYLSDNDLQSNKNFDAWDCVSESAVHLLEIQFNYLYQNGQISIGDCDWLSQKGYLQDGKFEFSSRFIAKLSNTRIGYGNDAETVANTIKNYGLIPCSLWDISPEMTAEQYYTEISQDLKDLGAEFVKRFGIRYEWISKDQFTEGLKIAPIQVFVDAWHLDDKGLYKFVDAINHAVVLVKKDTINDTYNPFVKVLEPDYNYQYFGMKYYINLNNKPMNFSPANNQLYLLVEGPEQKLGMGLNGQVVVYPNKIDTFMNAISREKSYTNKAVPKPVTMDTWNSMVKVDGKGNPIN